jgi:hypothetical protein
MLLGVSIVGYAVVKTGLIPTKISALGIEFNQSNQQALLNILALITTYFLVAFVIYVAADFLAWHRAYHEYLVNMDNECEKEEKYHEMMLDHAPEEEVVRMFEYEKRFRFTRIVFALYGPVSKVRVFFEFILPILVGCYALYVLRLPAILTAIAKQFFS